MPAPSNATNATFPRPESADGRWFLVALGVGVALVGGLFIWLMGRSYLRAREMHSWPEVPCVVLSSVTDERRHDPNSPTEFRQLVSFGYVWKGTPRTGDQIGLRGSPWTSKPDVIARRALEYPVGKTTTCRVNPANPDLAYLKPDSLAPGYSIWFPSLFVVGGIGIAVSALRRGRMAPSKGPAITGSREKSSA